VIGIVASNDFVQRQETLAGQLQAVSQTYNLVS
jgi:hypothetical protein